MKQKGLFRQPVLRLHPLAAACMAITTLGAAPLVQAGDDITAALTGGTPNLDMRLRYETVDQDGVSKDAKGLTLRTRLGYRTGDYRGFKVFAEFEDTTAIGDDDFNSSKNGKTNYPTIADPDATEVNQAYIDYTGLSDTTLRYGLQRVILDNARFVGNVGWRQNEQTFNGFSLVNTSLPDTTLVYGYVTNVNTITDTDIDVKAHVLNAGYNGLSFGKLTAYAYLIEFTNSPAASQKTLGLRFAGSHDMDGWSLLYTAEYAQQSDYKDGDNGIDGDYQLFELGAKVSGITAKVSYELLGADNYSGFETPIATKHAFNGWADKFLNTPADGLKDVFVTVGGSLAGVKLKAVYHDFSSDRGSTDYGTEWDLLAAKKFGKHYSVGAKYANYDADNYLTDTSKFWLWGSLKF
ncbi:alginate export family protein [Thiohalobacter sp. IOR34]|uniref:alginate export family protein n=1 Tax=Thiohalobacter sp. IOR34 TaxID=3057176 RepID=UPI0025B0BE87|nr:alginate export family protein [Thiohalobacter sp. IOR34]WJW76169.1 alginate export family protein [Thiohalobacter sp. IOR34]